MTVIHVDKNIGISAFPIHWMTTKTGKKMFWCRRAIAFMGSTNMPVEDILSTSPFDPKFNDNYVEGKGESKEQALAMMEAEENQICNMLWSV